MQIAIQMQPGMQHWMCTREYLINEFFTILGVEF